MREIAASLLSATDRVKAALSLLSSGVTWIHYDVMDGLFTPRASLSIAELDALLSSLPPHQREVHLMVKDPLPYLEHFLSRVTLIAMHVEAVEKSVLKMIFAKHGASGKLGLALNPGTPLSALSPFINEVAYVIVMSVEAGAGGQVFQPAVLAKVAALRAKFPRLIIVVDGGINYENASAAFASGASVVVSGSYLINLLDQKDALTKFLALRQI